MFNDFEISFNSYVQQNFHNSCTLRRDIAINHFAKDKKAILNVYVRLKRTQVVFVNYVRGEERDQVLAKR